MLIGIQYTHFEFYGNRVKRVKKVSILWSPLPRWNLGRGDHLWKRSLIFCFINLLDRNIGYDIIKKE